MYYILIQTVDDSQMYQEVERGTVVRYCDLDGNTVMDPTVANWVVDANPPQPIWALPDNPIVNPPSSTIVSRLSFRNKFTMQEKAAIYNEANTNVLVKIWLDDLANSEYVDINSSNTIDGVNNLYQLGLLTQPRVEEILNA